MIRRVVVTGATGFVGTALLGTLVERGLTVTGVSRGRQSSQSAVEWAAANIVSPDVDWARILRGAGAVIHLASRVHVMQESSRNPMEAYRTANVEATLRLAEAAVRAGVRRFIFVSSIKVNGEATGQPFGPDVFKAESVPRPLEPYGLSKLEAENGLFALAHTTGLEAVIIRPPLVYGPGVKANFLTLMRWLRRGVPLPLGAIHNRRSLVALDNLVDLIVTCLDHPAAANQVFLAGDGEDLSTTDLMRRLAVAMEVPARLIPVPAWALEGAAAVLGKHAVAQRLCGDLRVDISKAQELLGWAPPVSVDEGLRRAASGFSG